MANPSLERSSPVSDEDSGGLNVDDVVFILSEHRWKICLLTLAGLAAATLVYFVLGPSYETNAKLLVRYVLERSAVDQEAGSSIQRNNELGTASALRTEMEILKSWDLARSVTEEIGPDKLAPPKIDPSKIEVSAAKAVVRNLKVVNEQGSNVISVTYQNNSPALAVDVLQRLIVRYFDKHLEIHRSLGASALIAEQTEQVRVRLEQLEEELTQAERAAGIYAFAEGAAKPGALDYSLELRNTLLTAESERAAQMARIHALEGIVGDVTNGQIPNLSQKRPSEAEASRYQGILQDLERLRERGLLLRAKFPPGNRLVHQNESDIASLETERKSMALAFPALLAITTGDLEKQAVGLDSERAKLASAEARFAVLREKEKVATRTEQSLPELIARIRKLQRMQRIEQDKYEHLMTAVDKVRIDELLDPSKIPNISVIQNPSPPTRELSSRLKKFLVFLVLAGAGSGLALAFLLELALDRRVKRPEVVERDLRIPLLASIPYLQPSPNAAATQTRVDVRDLLDRLAHSLRKRYAEKRPALLLVTGTDQGVGARTIASQLNQLCLLDGQQTTFIDLQAEHAAANSMLTAVEAATGKVPEGIDKSRPLSTKQVCALLPCLRQSGQDLIILASPPVGSGSPTWALASSVDKVLLLASADRTQRSDLRRCYDDLCGSGADVSCVLNKTRERRRNALAKSFSEVQTVAPTHQAFANDRSLAPSA